MASGSISSKVQSIFCSSACLLFHALFSMQNSASTDHDSLSKTDWQEIQMVPLEERDELCQLCSGMYVDPEKKTPRNNKFDSQLIEASAHKAELTNEKLTLSGGFEASQENQTLSGDKAELSREKSTIHIEGNVAIREPGLLLRGERATMQTQNKQIELSNATYTLHDQHIYGSAEALRRNDQGIVEIENGGFSYCSPIGNPSWYIETNSMELNPKSGVGKARGSILRVGGLPIAYLPWIEFPIGDKRRTGFLWPEIHTGPRGGLDLTFPIYLNLAPNYDLTYSPRYIQERGFEAWTAFAILSLIGLFNIFGTLSFGYLSGKYSKKILLSILYFSRGIVLILFLVLPTSTYVAIGFGVFYGFLWLSTIPPTNGIISQVFGTKYLAMLYGVVFLSHQIGSFLGAFLGGYFYDQYGSYDYAWYLSIALSFFATIVHLPIDEKPLPRLATT